MKLKLPAHRTKIVCTMGPATDKPGMITQLLKAGMNVARMNGAHGDVEAHRVRIRAVRAAAEALGVPVAILMDLPGPKHRLGTLNEPSLSLLQDSEIALGHEATRGVLPLADPTVLKDIRKGDSVFLADGTVRLIVLKANSEKAWCRVEVGGTVRSGSGLNLPTSKLSVQLPTEDDRVGIAFAVQEKLEWIGMSFVRSRHDVENVRRCLPKRGERPLMMAKIEKREALTNLKEIIKAADGVMVARGDLGVETPLEQVPLVQKSIIAEALLQGKPVVTATQMLESMVDHSSPTRAEVNDIANAVLDGTDAVMLSAETAIGAYAPAAVATLAAVTHATENQYPYAEWLEKFSKASWTSVDDAVSLAAFRLSYDLHAAAIVVSGAIDSTAFRIARFRPQAKVIVLSATRYRANQFAVVSNVIPLTVPQSHHSSAAQLRKILKKADVVKKGDVVVHVIPPQRLGAGLTDSIQILRI